MENIEHCDVQEFVKRVLSLRNGYSIQKLEKVLGKNWDYKLARYVNRKRNDMRVVMVRGDPWKGDWKELPKEEWYVEKI